MNQEHSKGIEAWLDRYVDYLAGDNDSAPRLEDLQSADQAEARRQAYAISQLWGRDAGPSDQPSMVAMALGFDRLDQNVAIDGPRLKARRQATGMKVSALATELRRLGWSVSAAELGEIESGKRPDIPGTALPLLLVSLNASVDDLTKVGTHRVDQLLSMDRVRAQVEATAQRLGRSFDEISAILRPQLAGAHFREHDSQEVDVVEIVQNLLDRID